ncbi:hypothetical protein LNTAR_19577 [Lentisphaera araneosa HTCC2155]|jgi:Ca2+-binding EF-hand superfamily protein|uniref:EF-hand domain-containing protein n=1 Tax=Lentisphaera araneosa HTCC2155 TaxID=313628 RepID=A6DQY1_9BACT|nr:EF-hand domain-containing protein [Lentisphaera araneosa]EDM26031.1 hypothetical protein LNTAR_19577 [Lentisphaera araneosa HTCC2155]
MFAGSVFASTLADKDTDKDGKLSVEEFAVDKKKLKKKFTKLDADKDGFLNEKEFVKSMKMKGEKEK